MLVNEDLSDTTPGVVDATEWVQVFLNSQNEQYLEQTKNYVAVPTDLSINAQVARDPHSVERVSSSDTFRESKDGAESQNTDSTGDLVGKFNEFSLSMEKLNQNKFGSEVKRTNEDDLNRVCFFKDQRMNVAYIPFQYLQIQCW